MSKAQRSSNCVILNSSDCVYRKALERRGASLRRYCFMFGVIEACWPDGQQVGSTRHTHTHNFPNTASTASLHPLNMCWEERKREMERMEIKRPFRLNQTVDLLIFSTPVFLPLFFSSLCDLKPLYCGNSPSTCSDSLAAEMNTLLYLVLPPVCEAGGFASVLFCLSVHLSFVYALTDKTLHYCIVC